MMADSPVKKWNDQGLFPKRNVLLWLDTGKSTLRA